MDSNQPAGLLALGVGVGLGLGVMLTAVQSQSRLLIPASYSRSGSSSATESEKQLLESELSLSVQDGRDITCTFDNFPYYLNEQTRVLLTNAAFVHLKQLQYSKFTRHLSPASRSVLLSGPIGMETYHQMLAKALAHFFQAKLLILDITSLALKMQKKRGICHPVDDSMTSAGGVIQRFLGGELLSAFVSGTRQTSDIKAKRSLDKKWKQPFNDKTLLLALQKVLQTLAEASPTILFLRDVEKIVFRDPTTSSLFQKMFNKLSGPIFIIGSRVQIEALSTEQASTNVDEKITSLFPYQIDIKPPEDDEKLHSWKTQLEEDIKAIRSQDNKNHISEVLAANDVECEDFDSLSFTDKLLSENIIEEIVVSAISYHLMNTEEPQYHGGRLVLSPKSLAHGLSLFQAGQIITKDGKLQLGSNPEDSKDSSESSRKGEGASEILESLKNGDTDPSKKTIDIEIKTSSSSPAKEFVPDNEFEKRIRPEMIPAGAVGVSFQDIGALDDVKEILHEAVMLPLQRPDLFSGGGLIKPCKGILLFGPPGTGKTMLAKAVATEAGASFINVSMSTITSKWFGEDEKNVRALFTLAAKVAPTIIFIDEVDSMLGQRSRNGEHEAMRKIKNEFMAHWDGLLSKPGERVLVLAATNRPFDLDDAIIRRFERRIMVALPNKENREKILRRILEKEAVADDIDYAELAAMTEGYTGSDLKNLCTVAAYRPLRELMKKEQKLRNEKNDDQADVKADENKQAETSKTASEDKESPAPGPDVEAESSKTPETEKPPAEPECSTTTKEESPKPTPQLRPLNMEDLKQAKRQVSSSFASEGAGMADLKEWNELFGEGGSRKKEQLSYFL